MQTNENIVDPIKETNENVEIKEDIGNIVLDILKQELPPVIEEETFIQTRYILGFALNPEKTQVLLITKNRPKWQAGLLNGIGGKIEEHDETVYHAMEREFKEETGITIPSHKWNLYNTMEGKHFKISVFWTISKELDSYQSVTDEIVSLVNIDDLFHTKFKNCISNLAWLIGMIMDADLERIHSEVRYQD